MRIRISEDDARSIKSNIAIIRYELKKLEGMILVEKKKKKNMESLERVREDFLESKKKYYNVCVCFNAHMHFFSLSFYFSLVNRVYL